MATPKRVRDSTKKTVWQDKKQVWEVNWELKVNWKWWENADTSKFETYGSSWAEPQEPLKTYGNWWEEVETEKTLKSITLTDSRHASMYVWATRDFPITLNPADVEVDLTYFFGPWVADQDFEAAITESEWNYYLSVTALQVCQEVQIWVIDNNTDIQSNTVTFAIEEEPTPVEPSIVFDSWTSDVMTTLEYWEDEKWSNSIAPIWFSISDMETSQLSFSVENCVTWISDTDVTVTYSAAEEWYDYALTISTAVDLSALTPNEEDESYFHVIPYYTEDVWETPVALWDIVVCAFVV